MGPKSLGIFTKRGDARSEVRQLVHDASREVGAPIEDGIDQLLYLKTDLTLAMLNEHGRYLENRLLSIPGWSRSGPSP
jgi:hypothetical protein